MSKPPSASSRAHWAAPALACGLLLVAAPARAQTSIQGTAGGSAGANDNARSVATGSGFEIEPATYLVGSGRLDLRHVTRTRSFGLSYALSAYKYLQPASLSDTVTHTADANSAFELGPDRVLGLGASFTRGQLNILVPFGSPVRPGEPGVTNLPDIRGPALRQEGPLDYVSFGLRQSLEYRYRGANLVRQSFATTFFNPIEDRAERPEAWTFDLLSALERRLSYGFTALGLARLGHVRSGTYTLGDMTLQGRTLSFVELMGGMRRHFGPYLSGEAAAGLYGTFNADNPVPRLGPAARAEVRYEREPTLATLRFEHTVTGSAMTADTFIADAFYATGALALDRFQTLRVYAGTSFQRGRRVRDGIRRPGRVLVFSASGGLEWDPDGPLRFTLEGTSLYQSDKSGASEEMLTERKLRQNLVLFTTEATYPSVVRTARRETAPAERREDEEGDAVEGEGVDAGDSGGLGLSDGLSPTPSPSR